MALQSSRYLKGVFMVLCWSGFIRCTEVKEAKLRKKQLQRQLKMEEQLANAAYVWNNEILPKWDTM